MSISTVIECPLCTWTVETNPPPTPPSVQLAAALGASPDALAGLWSHQEAARVEGQLDQHLRTHPPTVWLPQLMAARNEVKRLQEALAAEKEHIHRTTRGATE